MARRALRRLAGALALAAAAAALPVLAIGIGSLPGIRGSQALQGLDGPATIARDVFGVPHIQASSERDAYRALGYAQAQDRLWQMEFQRRVAQGRLAEVVGAAALPVDRYLRVLGLRQAAEASLAALDPHSRDLLDAYVRGINDWIEGRDRLLPPEFWIFWHEPEPWTAADSAVWIKMMALTLDGDMNGELLRSRLAGLLSPDQLQDLWPGIQAPEPERQALPAARASRLLATLPAPPGPGTGSNAFAVAASRSASGAALLAGDPHLELRTPGVWYLAHLRAPGLAVTGATMPGLPFVVIGRNDTLAWSLTTTGADVQDLFVETLDPADPSRYLTPDGPQPFELRQETIRVAGGQPETLEVRRTRHGPVISDLMEDAARPGTVLSLSWTALDPADTTIAAGFRLAHAADLQELRTVLAAYRNPVQNFVAADATGAVGLLVAGAVPIRRSGDGSMPGDGASGESDWVGTIPADQLPVRLDPATGVVANGNDRVEDGDYPYTISATAEPVWRRRRIEALLAGRDRLDGTDLIRIQRDHRSGFARDLLPVLLRTDGLPPALAELRDAMRGWDGTMAEDSWRAGLFLAFAEHLSRLVRSDELGAAAGEVGGLRGAFLVRVVRQRQAWCDDRRTPVTEDCAALAARALAQAHQALVATFGPEREAWSLHEVQTALLPHPVLDSVPVLGRLFGHAARKAGDPYSVDVAGASVDPALVRRTVTHAASLRILVDLAEPDAIQIVAAGGQSGHPWSRWFGDGVDRYAADRRTTLPSRDLPVRLELTPAAR
ncbi:penicillin acylase family protein [Geminicoccus roseus]|uniref:penicillin acylase family protein n=1 Tax=Geminicoccus roseus TaxID=404900 RepID=UPI0003FE4704|nr:penicillin acylase family protein [Geminicoccus roseus]